MKSMTTTRRWILRIALIFLLTIFIAQFVVYHVDYSEYKGFKHAIKSEGFEIRKKWIYEEDFVLEDFGFYVEKPGLEFWIDVRNVSDVRSPDARIEGILLESMQEERPNRERVILFNSDFWREKQLPTINTPREFLSHAHIIVPAILKSKATFPKIDGGTYDKAYANFLIIRDDPSDKAHTIYLSDEK